MCPPMLVMLKRLRMVPPLLRKLRVIHRAVNVHHRRDSRGGRLVRGRVVDQEPAGRFADQRDLSRVDVISLGVRLNPADRAVDVRLGLRKAEFRRHPVIHAEPGEPGVGQNVKQRPYIRAAATCIEPASVNQDGRGKRPRPIGHV